MNAKTRTVRRIRSFSVFAAVMGVALAACAEDGALVIFDFEDTTQGWAIPEWALTSADYVGKALGASQQVASQGKGAVELTAEFPGGGRWTGAYAEIEMHVTDWTQFTAVAVDLYVPADAPAGLRGRIILTVGPDWTWTEMNRGIPLVPGQWTTVTANLKPGSMDWKFFPEDAFRGDVRKVGIRLESDKKPAYAGSVFFDTVRLLK